MQVLMQIFFLSFFFLRLASVIDTHYLKLKLKKEEEKVKNLKLGKEGWKFHERNAIIVLLGWKERNAETHFMRYGAHVFSFLFFMVQSIKVEGKLKGKYDGHKVT